VATHPLLERLGLTVPIIQAPMAGTSTPALAAAVSKAGALGSIAIGHIGVASAGDDIARLRAATNRAFNVNVFCHAPAARDAGVEAAWLAQLAPAFAAHGAAPPATLNEIYPSFVDDDARLALLLEARAPVVSFHFGLPPRDRIAALKGAGAILLATATNLGEADAAAAAGVDAIVAQGFEAGGHRGVFDPSAPDEQLGTFALVRRLSRALDVPIIAAGGVMDGAGVAAALALGAVAVQMGTAFIACPEAGADAAHRDALLAAESPTVMTRAISGRPARSLANLFTDLGEALRNPPAYPRAYDAGKALNAAARARGVTGYGAWWAGQGAPLARAMPAARLIGLLSAELADAQSPRGLA
jgi:nitronate monooxygenase